MRILMIDLERDLYYVALNHYDVVKSISLPSIWGRIVSFITRKAPVFQDSNVKEFGALALQELERMGLSVVLVVPLANQLTPLKEIVSRVPLLLNLECCLVPPSFVQDWSLGRGAQFISSYDDLKQLMAGLDNVVEEE